VAVATAVAGEQEVSPGRRYVYRSVKIKFLIYAMRRRPTGQAAPNGRRGSTGGPLDDDDLLFSQPAKPADGGIDVDPPVRQRSGR
jgi:hypothetical protein